MTKCYLCGNDAKMQGWDYGRKKKVFCEADFCGPYDITNAAVAELENNDFPDSLKKKLSGQAKNAKISNKKFEIYFDAGKGKLVGRTK